MTFAPAARVRATPRSLSVSQIAVCSGLSAASGAEAAQSATAPIAIINATLPTRSRYPRRGYVAPALTRIVHVVGARPNFMKVAPMMSALAGHSDIDQRLVHTGQHYDDVLSGALFEDLELPQP